MGLGLEHVALIPQLFTLRRNDEAILLTILNFDDILLTGPDDALWYFVHKF